jgi:hypothetical protein
VVRLQLKAGVVGRVCRIKPINSHEIVYTRRSERQAWALLKLSYQATYYSVIHITVFGGAFWRGFGGVGAVFNARGLVCACVNRARKFMPLAWVMFLESKRAKTHMTQVCINTARCKHARAIGLGGVEVQLGR